MSRRIFFMFVFACSMVVAPPGCTSTEEIYLRSQLQHPEELGPIEIFTKDTMLYKLETYSLRDSSFAGIGYVTTTNDAKRFKGEIFFDRIEYVRSNSASIGKGILIAATLGTFTLIAKSYGSADGMRPMTATEFVHYQAPPCTGCPTWGGGGGSCPFVYSWNGAEYILEGEAFATAWGKALEMTTVTVVPRLNDDNETVRIRIANERPETHHINSVQLFAAEVDSSARVVADPAGSLWPVYESLPPATAKDNFGNDISSTLQARDNRYWQSDLDAACNLSTFRDTIEVTFLKAARGKEATLVLHAINTRIFDAVMRQISQILGEENLAFVHALEHDQEMISLIRDCLNESSLNVTLWNGREWESVGAFAPEANEVPFSRVLRFSTEKIRSDSVKIRLSCLSDVWKLDAVKIDWSDVRQLEAHLIPLLSARENNGMDHRSNLASADNNYAVLLPPDFVDFTFSSFRGDQRKKIAYAVRLRGYLYEWFPSTPKAATVLAVGGKFGGRIEILKLLLSQRTMFLSVLYREWRKLRKEELLGRN